MKGNDNGAKQLLSVIALAACSGLAGAMAVGALLSGVVDNPIFRGGVSVVSRSTDPSGFWLLLAFFICLSVVLAAAAYSVSRRRRRT